MPQARVVIDATPLLYRRTGIGRFTWMLIRSLVDLAPPLDLMLFGRRLGGEPIQRMAEGLPARRLRLPRATEPAIRALGLVELLCRGDLYHATDFYLPMRSKRTNVVATVHDTIFLARPEAMVDHARLARWVPDFVRGCRRLIAPSESARLDIEKHLGFPRERIDIVHPGVERSLFHAGGGKESARERLRARMGLHRPFFLAVSCSTGRKNTAFLLDAYRALAQNAPANDLVLVWNPPPEVRSRYSRGTGADSIHFLGQQPDDMLADLYRGATALVFPSLYEGFGLPVLEAMACGTPVICSNSSSLPEIGGDAALYIDPEAESTLVRALEICESEPHRLATMSRLGIARANQFSWERCARETADVYERCLG